MSDFMSALQNEAEKTVPNVAVTENGAIGLKTSGKKLVDLNFSLSSMRNMSEKQIWNLFLGAYNENPHLALLWLFFARDCREGCGERNAFRVIFRSLCHENDAVAVRLLRLISFYGRWDDLIDVCCGDAPILVRDKAFEIICEQLDRDIAGLRASLPISLLAKWMPSSVTSSRETRRRAEIMRNLLRMSPKAYRKTFSTLRKHLNVTEQKMSAGKWDQIDYSAVPSRAAMNYRDAFDRHDRDRYLEYLTNVKESKAKINAGVLFPHDIVHAYMRLRDVDETLELQWKALPDTVRDSGTLVVVDGSGSMCCCVGNTMVTCHDVARSIGIYFAEKLKGPYRNKFVTFSQHPRFVSFDDHMTLRSKIDLMEQYCECANTDIQKVFDLVLDTAMKNHLKQDELPANILIVSDMEFDEGTCYNYYEKADQTLFDEIRERWEFAGYKLPRLVFWNVCSRTGAIPMSSNELGVALVSGFSQNIADMVMSGETDPYQCILNKLNGPRYKPVSDALEEVMNVV